MPRDGGAHRALVSRNAGDQRGAADVVSIQLGDPTIGERLGRPRRIPSQLRRNDGHRIALVSGRGALRQQLEVAGRKEMTVRVTEHR